MLHIFVYFMFRIVLITFGFDPKYMVNFYPPLIKKIYNIKFLLIGISFVQ